MAGRSEWRRLWEALRQFEGDPLANLGEVEAVAKSLVLSSVKEDNRQGKCVASFPNQVYGNQTSRTAVNEYQPLPWFGLVSRSQTLTRKVGESLAPQDYLWAHIT